MDEISERRKRLFSGAKFSTALFYNGDASHASSPSFVYFSGCNVDGCYLVQKKNGGTLLTHEMNYAMAKNVSRYPVKLLGKDAVAVLKKAVGTGTVGFAAGEMPAARFLALRKKLKAKFMDAGEKISEARSFKSAGELAKLSASAKTARKLLDALDPWQCKTENELARLLKIVALEASAEISFEPIVASGKNSRFPHHQPTDAKLGDFVLVDFGVKKDGYCSDFTRCYFRNRKVAEKEREAYNKCRRIFGELLDALKAGKCKTGKDLALLSDSLVKKHGLPTMIHAIGHGIGLEVHEAPHLGARSKDSLEGAVLAIEPAAYFTSFGVRYEEMVANVRGRWRRI